MAIGTLSDFLATSPLLEEPRNSRTPEGAWIATLWQSAGAHEEACCIYIDGHRKPVYAEKLIPRGLIGCSGKILGCRALVLLHDEQRHPRGASTHRGDQHLTMGLPPILARYQDSERETPSVRVIVDREGMAAPFLRDLKATSPYRGDHPAHGSVRWTTILHRGRDVYATGARSAWEPGEKGEPRPVSLFHYLTRKASFFLYEWPSFVTCAVAFPVRKRREETDEDVRKPAWWQAEWKAEPTPATPTIVRLIPIVTTADTIDAVELAQTYTRRWPVQENIIRDFLVPLGLDTNHGYGKRPIVNSEEAREGCRVREALEHCRAMDGFCASSFSQSLSAL